jgi:hypothetical protein
MKGADNFSQLSNINPGQFVDNLFNLGKGLVAMRNGHHRVSLTLGFLRENTRESAVAGD